ncbi:dienelactone hydrolase family protein [bacterium]|nr:dienelactone hydrolase family protein [bacterium]
MRTIHCILATLLFTALLATAALAEPEMADDTFNNAMNGEAVAYSVDGTAMEGLLFLTTDSGPRPAVLICHAWMGIGENEKQYARALSQMGYVVFCGDMYGVDVRPKNPEEARAATGPVRGNRTLFRRRMNAALDILKGQPNVDPARCAAIGFCFGGTGVLELARSGAEINCVVSFHGGLDASDPALPVDVKCKVLVLHGADDPFVAAEDLAAFEQQMREHKVDWQLYKYGGAVHAFTEEGAGNDPSKGAAYDEKAAKRAFAAMLMIFEEEIAPGFRFD